MEVAFKKLRQGKSQKNHSSHAGFRFPAPSPETHYPSPRSGGTKICIQKHSLKAREFSCLAWAE